MEAILELLKKVDFNVVMASCLSFIVGIGLIKPKFDKAMRVIGEVADLLSEIHKASADGKYSPEEIQSIAKEGQELIASFK